MKKFAVPVPVLPIWILRIALNWSVADIQVQPHSTTYFGFQLNAHLSKTPSSWQFLPYFSFDNRKGRNIGDHICHLVVTLGFTYFRFRINKRGRSGVVKVRNQGVSKQTWHEILFCVPLSGNSKQIGTGIGYLQKTITIRKAQLLNNLKNWRTIQVCHS